MEIVYRTVNLELRPEHREVVEAQLERLETFASHFPRPLARVDIERSARKGGYGVGIQLKLSTRPLFASAWAGDVRSSVEAATDRLVRQARKHIDILRRDERPGAGTARTAAWERTPSRAELESAHDLEAFRDQVGHHAAHLNRVLRRERRLDPRAESAGTRVSIPDIVEDALAYVFEHWREIPAHLTPDRWLVRRGLMFLDEELERATSDVPGSETVLETDEVLEDWEDLMDLPLLDPRPMDRRPASEARTSPEVIQDRTEAQRATAEALKGLPGLQRKAVLLRHLEGYDLPEIAFVLNAREEQVEEWLMEGETRLQDQLGSWRRI